MTKVLVAVAEGETRFNPTQIAAAIVHRWPSTEVAEVDGSELTHLAALMTMQVTIIDTRERAVVEFNGGDRSISIEGDEETTAEVIALLTTTSSIPDNVVAVMNWADGIAFLRQNMASSDVVALRG